MVAVLNVFIKLMGNLDIFSYILNVSITDNTFSCTKTTECYKYKTPNNFRLIFTVSLINIIKCKHCEHM
jgi:hypothetical protein